MRTAFAGKVPERIPVMAHNFMMAVAEAGVTFNRFRDDPRVMFEVMSDATIKYDLDCVLLDVDTALLSSAGLSAISAA